jgi:hypothetical protein
MSIANELITRGWTQGDYVRDDGSVCLIGAVRCAFAHDYRARCNAALCVDRVLGQGAEVWNDTEGRTFDEVLRVAKLVDEILGA